MQEALGDSWNRAGEFDKAANSYAAARRLVGADPLAEAALLLKRSRLEEKLGKYPQALRWAARARKALAGLTGPDAALQAARSSSWYATVLQAQGRNADAIRWADRAIAEAEAVDDPDALGAGYFVKGWAYAALGNEGWEPLVQRSLAAYQRSGDRVKQAVILSNVGVVCQGEGRWDEAMDYYERGRDACLKIGDVFGAAVARMNVAEILADRGELAEAEPILLESLQSWRASKYRYFLGYCLSLLGRVALRAGRMDDALGRFEEAKANFVHVGAEQDALATDARIAECNVFLGNADAALELAERALSRAASTNAVAPVAPLLERVRGEALLQRGDVDGARHAFAASLAAGRTPPRSLRGRARAAGADPARPVRRRRAVSGRGRGEPVAAGESQGPERAERTIAFAAGGDVKTGISQRGAKDAEKYVTVLFTRRLAVSCEMFSEANRQKSRTPRHRQGRRSSSSKGRTPSVPWAPAPRVRVSPRSDSY